MRSEPGVRVYLLLHPIRTVPAAEPSGKLPFTLAVTTHTHVSVVVAPSSATGPTAVHVPLTGHNLLLAITAGTGEDVVVETLAFRTNSRSVLDADGVHIIQPHFMPPFSADLVDPVLRSMTAYEPLKAPDYEIDLDSGMVRRLDASVPDVPLRVPAGKARTIVLAPITDIRDLVRWTLRADISCAGRTHQCTWEMMVTAEMMMERVAGPHAGERTAVHELFSDHWHRGASRQAIASGEAEAPTMMPATHGSADGSGYLRLPPLDAEPEPKKAAKLRKRGNRRAARGRTDQARAAYTAAAEAGSSEAAYWLGFLSETGGDTEGAQRWYTQAAEQNFFPAFNDLAVLHHRHGDLNQAEYWFHRGMDAGDWTAAAGLGAVLLQRGDAESETVLRMVAGTMAGKAASEIIGDELAQKDLSAAAGAADLLADLLHEQGRTEEAVELWEEAAANGKPRASFSLGKLCRDRGDRAGAERWWRQSAEAGFQLSAYHLGSLFHEDGGTAEAERWWRKAAEVLERTLIQGASTVETDTGRQIMIGRLDESGEVKAAYELGMSLLNRGQRAEAEHWLTLAARGGHRAAQYELAEGPAIYSLVHDEGAQEHWEEPIARAIQQDGWLVLPKPDWKPSAPTDSLPTDAMVGGWQLDEEGRPGPFQPNPHYVPADKATPTDPMHELLCLAASGQGDGIGDQLLSTLRNTVVEFACDGSDRLLVGPSPDGVACAAVVTAAVHKRRLGEARWVSVLGSKLPEIVPAGLDILINPGDPAQIRLLTGALRESDS